MWKSKFADIFANSFAKQLQMYVTSDVIKDALFSAFLACADMDPSNLWPRLLRKSPVLRRRFTVASVQGAEGFWPYSMEGGVKLWPLQLSSVVPVITPLKLNEENEPNFGAFVNVK